MSFQVTTAIKKIHALEKRNRVIQGGTSAGKTYGILPILIDRACREKALEISVVSHSLPHLKRGAMKDFLKIMKATGRYYDERWNRTDFIYRFANGSYMEFFSADQSDKVVGPRRDVLYINECNRIEFATYHQLAIRTRKERYLDYNPAEEFWVHEEVIPDVDTDFIVLTYKDNEALEQSIVDEIEKAKAKAFHNPEENWNDEHNIKNPYWANWWKVYGLGEVGALQGAIFSNWKEGEFDESIPYIYAMDFGFANDPDTLIKIAIDEARKIIYIHELMYENGQSTGRLVDQLNEIIEDKSDLIIADSAEMRTIEDLYQEDFNIRPAAKGPDSVRNGIKRIQDYEIIITPESLNAKKEIRAYIWSDKKSETPVDKNNHIMDPMRYGFDELTGGVEMVFI